MSDFLAYLEPNGNPIETIYRYTFNSVKIFVNSNFFPLGLDVTIYGLRHFVRDRKPRPLMPPPRCIIYICMRTKQQARIKRLVLPARLRVPQHRAVSVFDLRSWINMRVRLIISVLFALDIVRRRRACLRAARYTYKGEGENKSSANE